MIAKLFSVFYFTHSMLMAFLNIFERTLKFPLFHPSQVPEYPAKITSINICFEKEYFQARSVATNYYHQPLKRFLGPTKVETLKNEKVHFIFECLIFDKMLKQ